MTTSETREQLPIAVVVGVCSHGLAIVRSLARHGVEVVALEANRTLPGTRTRHAAIRFVQDINGPGLIDELLRVRTTLPNGLPVLFLTNDNMVRVVGQHWERLEGHYRLSWSGARTSVVALLSKDVQVEYCLRSQCRCPQTHVIGTVEQADEIGRRLDYPVILKPTRPMSSFKVFVARSRADLMEHATKHSSAFPILVQDYVPGGEDRLRFFATYLRNGEPLAHFAGKKLRSRPMGHTTSAVPCADDALAEFALRFFRESELSGPASLEVKLDPDGEPWVIEPTVGRTDFWLKLCIANGVDLPWIEYCDQTGRPIEPVAKHVEHVWCLTERDPLSSVAYVGRMLTAAERPRRFAFAYLDGQDLAPFWASAALQARQMFSRASRKIGLSPRCD